VTSKKDLSERDICTKFILPAIDKACELEKSHNNCDVIGEG